jgi:hypothetical protein
MAGEDRSGRGVRAVLVAVLVMSAGALLTAPLLMPASYSWWVHTTSESAAQGVPGAWLARLGFLVFGMAVIVIGVLARPYWGRLTTSAHVAFGVLMCAAAAFSSRGWEAGAAFDSTEDLLHSVAATGMGFAFALGVVALSVRRRVQADGARALDLVAVAAAVMLPLAMSALPDLAGLFQRGMFAIAYAWYGREASSVSMARGTDSVEPRAAPA